MDGTSLYVNLKTGPGGVGMPPGSAVGDVMQWNGVEWVPRQPEIILAGLVDSVMEFLNVEENSIPTITIPAGKMVVSIIFAAKPGVDSAQLSGGSTSNGFDAFMSRAIAGRNATYNPEGITIIEVNKVFSFTASTRLYLTTSGEGDTWNGMIANIYLVVKSLI